VSELELPKLPYGSSLFHDCCLVSKMLLATLFECRVGAAPLSLQRPLLTGGVLTPCPFFMPLSPPSSVTFFVELMAFRVGSKIAQNLAYDPHTGGHHHAAEHVGPRAAPIEDSAENDSLEKKASLASDVEQGKERELSAAASQILGVAVLEFGVIFHSVIIGLTLGTTSDFTTLFIVIIFHQVSA